LVDVSSALRPAARRALAILLDAFNAAGEGDSHLWDYAIEIAELRAAGVPAAALRVLVKKGYVQHAVEKRQGVGKPRRFGKVGRLRFADKSCFVLTDAGAAAARRLGGEVPFYDRDQRELWARGQLVKRYRQRAPDQETILLAFQELGWPRRIDDPLTRHPGKDSTERLGGVVARLNHHQKKPLIRFERDGTGEGIIWRFTDE
jgi:hypothetical protein